MSASKPNHRDSLPIDEHVAEIVHAVETQQTVILQAAPGTGKTTRVPVSLLSQLTGQIVVLEPRRLAAKLTALRVAEEYGEACGETIGYAVRFDRQESARTRLSYLTEGLFMRRLSANPGLEGISCVVLDEFHERNIHTDLALACVRELQLGDRPDLKLIVMSATLDTAGLDRYLPDAAVIQVPGRTYPVDTVYLPANENQREDLSQHCARGVEYLWQQEQCPGDILVFLPGRKEINDACQAIKGRVQNCEVLPLTADLPVAQQRRVFAKSKLRKVIVATNVAETSITLPGITGVVDSGLAKIAGHALWSGMPTLDTKKVPQAACIQRAGRAGRVAAGIAVRLFDESDFLGRPAYLDPDIKRLDLADTALEVLHLLAQLGKPGKISSLADALPWFEPPSADQLDQAAQVLHTVGAVNESGELTEAGIRMASLPLHPRLAAALLAAQAQGIADYGCWAVALLSEGSLLPKRWRAVDKDFCDVAYQLHAAQCALLDEEFSSYQLEQAIHQGPVKRLQQLARQLGQSLKIKVSAAPPPSEVKPGQFLLAGFADRVALKRDIPKKHQKRGGGTQQALYNFCLGRGGILSDSSVVQEPKLILALEAMESVQARSAAKGTMISLAAGIERGWLLAGQLPLASAESQVEWNESAQRAELVDRQSYGQLTLGDAPVRDGNRLKAHRDEFSNCLQTALASHWPGPFGKHNALDLYHAKRAALLANNIDLDLPEFKDELLELFLATLCEGRSSFKDLEKVNLATVVTEQLSYEQAAAMASYLPNTIDLSNGRRLKLTYGEDGLANAECYIQDVYGLAASPAIADERIPVRLVLLAPNKRPAQTTSDLKNFWQRTYPSLAKDLGRRYPRHYWPEDPVRAKPVLLKRQLEP